MCKMMYLHLGLPYAFHDWTSMPLLNNASSWVYDAYTIWTSLQVLRLHGKIDHVQTNKRESHIRENMLGSWIEALQWYLLLKIGEDKTWNKTSNTPQAASCSVLEVYWCILCAYLPTSGVYLPPQFVVQKPTHSWCLQIRKKTLESAPHLHCSMAVLPPPTGCLVDQYLPDWKSWMWVAKKKWWLYLKI